MGTLKDQLEKLGLKSSVPPVNKQRRDNFRRNDHQERDRSPAPNRTSGSSGGGAAGGNSRTSDYEYNRNSGTRPGGTPGGTNDQQKSPRPPANSAHRSQPQQHRPGEQRSRPEVGGHVPGGGGGGPRPRRENAPAPAPQAHRQVVYCDSCKKTMPDVEFYEHSNKTLSVKWLCVRCADQFKVLDNDRQTAQSDFAKKRLFRREYGPTLRKF